MKNVATTALNRTTSRRKLVGAAAALPIAAAVATASPAHAAEAPAANRICDILGIEKPVIQAVMLGLTSPELSAAVSNAGGMGILELPTAETLQAVKELTDKPVCAALYGYDDETASMLQEAGINIVIYADGGSSSSNDFAVNVEPIKQFKEAGFTVLYKGLNATRQNIEAVAEAGADIIVVIGFGAGGCGPVIPSTTSELLAEISQNVDVPLLAAGGIVDAKTAAIAAAAGAEGAYVGTRFLACDEAPCAGATKQAIIDARAEDLYPVPWEAGSNGFMLETPSPVREEALAMAAQGATPADIFGCSAQIYAAMAAGNVDETGICVGCGASMINEVSSAEAIVNAIAEGFGR